jgi:arsenate reductase
VNAFGNVEFDYVMTLCDNAREACAYSSAKTRLLHRGFDDPPKLAIGARDEEEAMARYRGVRDEIRAFVETLPFEVNNQEK